MKLLVSKYLSRQPTYEMAPINFHAAWISILMGLMVGTIHGLFFHDPNWLGGYTSWPRRLLRLGHISFFGTAFLNLFLVFSCKYVCLPDETARIPLSFALCGMVLMPVVCFLSAVNDKFRHLFFIPVMSLIGSAATFVWLGIISK